MPKSIAELKRRHEHALAQADQADDLLVLLRQVVSTFGFEPQDLFDADVLQSASGRNAEAFAPYSDGAGNTWSGRGRRPIWLSNALAAWATLESFQTRRR